MRKTLSTIESDVDAVIMFMYSAEDGKEKDVAEVIAACLKTHGVIKVISNLLERSQTPIIRGLVDVIKVLI